MASKLILPLLSVLFQTALANVEKTIFLGPPSATIPLRHPTLRDLRLDVLTPETSSSSSSSSSSLRTHIEAEFPSDSNKGRGRDTWLLLDNLTPGQRYEVRICWPASQPTTFLLDTYEVETVWSTPELIGSLAEFSVSRQALPDAGAPSPPPGRARGEREASVLFLRISAAAEYFTTNATLMSDAAPVYADVILDPYLLNVLPRSLVPTVCYVLVVAAASWLVAQSVLAGIRGLVAAEEGGPSGDAKKER